MKRIIRRAGVIIAAATLTVGGASFGTDGWEIHDHTADRDIHSSSDDNQWH